MAASSNISLSDPIYSVAVSLKQDITASSYLVSLAWEPLPRHSGITNELFKLEEEDEI